MHIYRSSNKYRGSAIGLLIAYIILLFKIMPVILHNEHWVALSLLLFILILFVYYAYSVWNNKVIISETHISSNINGPTRSLALNDIKGVEISDKKFTLIPIDYSHKKITVDNRIKYYDEVLSWATQAFTTLKDYRDQVYLLKGTTITETALDYVNDKQKTIIARRITKYVEIYAIVSTFGFLVLSIFEEVNNVCFFILPALSPLLALLAAARYGKLVIKNKVPELVMPAPLSAYLVPAIALPTYLTYESVNTIHTSAFWLYVMVVSLGLFILTIFIYKWKLSIVVNMILFGLLVLYAVSVVTLTNYSLDNSPPQRISAIVKEKFKKGPKTTIHYFNLQYNKQLPIFTAKTEKGIYDNTEVGERVKMVRKPGKLGVPWYVVQE